MAKLGYFNSVCGDDGKPCQATITVFNAGTEVLATIWADAGGTIVKDNPFQTDALGRFQFFASAGAYDVQASGTGITTYKIENIQLSDITKSTQLTDMPGSLTDQGGKGIKVKADGTAYELVGSQAWTAPTLLNSWVNYGDPLPPVGYRKDISGFVHIRGTVKSGTIGAAIFNLPAGYRPAKNESFAVATSSDSVTFAFALLHISSGDVLAFQGNNYRFELNGIVFLAEA